MKQTREIIRDLREDRDIKQKTVAEYLNVSQQAYSNYENGRREIPIRVIVKLADYYEVSTDYLLGAKRHYAGSTDLSQKYVGAITMHDIVYEIQKLSPQSKRDLLKCIQFLKESERKKPRIQ
ncbi:MAG: helix-turn-helix domain-containing protein [Bacteroidales bacterium]|nr:helix-turn-helix domain-containing protein [Bacteroidales bacterium]MCM1416959.1 helix-turn-helix domain-containing protein [bacterium]MCM1424034.1 helix-turn-helix domain-containing protein [bacterium]